MGCTDRRNDNATTDKDQDKIVASDLKIGDVISIVFEGGVAKEDISEAGKVTIAEITSRFPSITGFTDKGQHFNFGYTQPLWLFFRPIDVRVPEPSQAVIDDYEVKIVFNDGTKTALYFKELDFIPHLNLFNVDRIVITPRWK